MCALQRSAIAYKFYCSTCHRYFNQQFPGIGKYQRASEPLQAQIFEQHTEGVSQKWLSRRFCIGKATIERWYHKGYKRAYAQKQTQVCPTVLGIDEHSFSKKEGYVTTLCNLKKHKVFDVVKGRCERASKSYFERLEGKELVKVVCIDLSSSYRQLIKRYFPNAKRVADRFHVVRLMLHHCLQTYQLLDPNLKYQRGVLKLLRTRPEK